MARRVERGPKAWTPKGITNVLAVMDQGRHRFSPLLKDFLRDLGYPDGPAPDFVSRDGWKWWSWYDVRDMMRDSFGEGSAEIAELYKILSATGDVSHLFLGTPPEEE
jgi:hypothetical protein